MQNLPKRQLNDSRNDPCDRTHRLFGSGKITLVRRLRADPAFADAGIIVNEYGEVTIDHDLVEVGRRDRTEREVRVTSGGCLCCTVGSDVRTALSDLLDASRTRGRPLARVVMETTGLADPAPIVNQIVRGGAPALGLKDHTVARTFFLAGVVATVDPLNAKDTLDSYLECVKQVAFDDRILLTKADLLHGAPERIAPLRDTSAQSIRWRRSPTSMRKTSF